MVERGGGQPEDAPLPPHLDPRGRRGRKEREAAARRQRPATSEPRRGSVRATGGATLPPHLDPRGRSAAPPAPAPVRTARRRRRGGRVLTALLVVLALLAVTAVGTLVWADRRIERIPVQAVSESGGDATVYLVVGSDSRSGLTEEELAQARTTAKEGDDGTLTDTLLLAVLPEGGGPATFVSFPRDSWVPIAGGEQRGRINSAYAVGERQAAGSGPDALVRTVEALSGLQVDHYLEVGFISFLRITDALGGVDVDLCAPAQDPFSGIDLPAGPQTLEGADALAFVRQRRGLPRGDLDRVARQQYFLGAVADEVLSPSTLLRPDRLVRLAGAVTSSIRADEDLSSWDLARLALELRGGLTFATVPVADPNATRGGASVVLLDEAALPGFFSGLTRTVEAPEPAAPVSIPPERVRLQVLNGTDRGGLAREAAEALAQQGFVVSGTGNADEPVGEQSVVLHGAERADSAQTVAAAVPGAVVRQDDSVGANGLVLVVGSGFSGTRPVTVAEAPAPASTAPPAPAGEAPPPAARPCIT